MQKKPNRSDGWTSLVFKFVQRWCLVLPVAKQAKGPTGAGTQGHGNTGNALVARQELLRVQVHAKRCRSQKGEPLITSGKGWLAVKLHVATSLHHVLQLQHELGGAATVQVLS